MVTRRAGGSDHDRRGVAWRCARRLGPQRHRRPRIRGCGARRQWRSRSRVPAGGADDRPNCCRLVDHRIAGVGKTEHGRGPADRPDPGDQRRRCRCGRRPGQGHRRPAGLVVARRFRRENCVSLRQAGIRVDQPTHGDRCAGAGRFARWREAQRRGRGSVRRVRHAGYRRHLHLRRGVRNLHHRALPTGDRRRCRRAGRSRGSSRTRFRAGSDTDQGRRRSGVHHRDGRGDGPDHRGFDLHHLPPMLCQSGDQHPIARRQDRWCDRDAGGHLLDQRARRCADSGRWLQTSGSDHQR